MATATIAVVEEGPKPGDLIQPVDGGSSKEVTLKLVELTFDGGDYVAGGISLDAEALGFGDDGEVLFFAGSSLTNLVAYDYANEKLQVGQGDYSASADGAHAEHGAAAISLVVHALVLGRF